GVPDLRLAPAGKHRSGGASETRFALGPAFDPGVRRRRLWPQPDGSGRLRTGGCSRFSRTRPGLHADLRMAAAPACPGRTEPVAGPARVQLSHVQLEPCFVVPGDAGTVRYGHPPADLSADRQGDRIA